MKSTFIHNLADVQSDKIGAGTRIDETAMLRNGSVGNLAERNVA